MRAAQLVDEAALVKWNSDSKALRYGGARSIRIASAVYEKLHSDSFGDSLVTASCRQAVQGSELRGSNPYTL